MTKYTNLKDLFTAIANAIRSKNGTSGVIVADNFPSEIEAIKAGYSHEEMIAAYNDGHEQGFIAGEQSKEETILGGEW